MQSFQYDWLDRLTSASTSSAGTGQYNHTYVYDSIGNITSYAGNSYTYGSSKPHAVTAAFGNSYAYDGVGNMTGRTIGGTTYTLSYDAENRMTGVSGGSISATFIYDAGGNRVKGTVNGTTTVYVAGMYEYQGGATTKYYAGPTGNVALRRTGYGSNNGVFYLLSDHLGSTSVLVNQNGTLNATNYYYPYGGNRGGAQSTLTAKRFTGQYHESGLSGSEGLYYYNARWFDAQLARFAQADTIVPNPAQPQSLNRYMYVAGNPMRMVDPSGHRPEEGAGYVYIPPETGNGGNGLTNSSGSSASAGSGWSPPPGYEMWYSNQYSGCFKCHAAKDTWSTALPNWELAAIKWAMQDSAWQASTEAIRTFDPIDYLFTIIECHDGGCSESVMILTLLPFLSGGMGDAVDSALTSVRRYEVGTVNNLNARSVTGDGLDIHHVPQKHPAGQVFSEYDPNTAPAIMLPYNEHRTIVALRGSYTGSARDLVAKDIWDLRNKTDAPNSSLQELIALIRESYPGEMSK